MNHLQVPVYLVLNIDETLKLLSRLQCIADLPIIDTEAILSGMIELLEKPNLTGVTLDLAVNWILHSHGLTHADLSPSTRERARGLVYAALLVLQLQLVTVNPYIDGMLPYRLKKIHGQHNVVLEHITLLPASNRHS